MDANPEDGRATGCEDAVTARTGEMKSRVLPLVSVIIAVRNEAATIGACLASLLEQQADSLDFEILVIDGASTDGTFEVLRQVSARDSRVRVLRNEKQHTPSAFNVGLKNARGEFVAVLGAHSLYARNYLSVCLRELLDRCAGGCGGRVITSPSADTLQARLAAAVMSHPFGSSRKSFRTQQEGFVDTVNYAVFRKAALIEAGGYSEELYRNQDNDMNQRLRATGHPLYCTWQTHCLYHPKDSLHGLLTYAYRNGFWNVLSFKRNSSSMAARHFIPCLFLTALIVTGLLALAGLFLPSPYGILLAGPFILIVGLHLTLGSGAAIQVAVRDRWAGALWLPLAFLAFHLSYGFGTCWAVLARAECPSPASQETQPKEERGGASSHLRYRPVGRS